MYYQHGSAHYCLRPYQQDTEPGKIGPSRHAACSACDSSTFGSTGNFDAIRPQTDATFDGLHCRAWNAESAGIPATESRMTSYRNDVTRRGEGDGRLGSVLPPPSPYDCKPPYSYISLIAFAIESSPHRRFILSTPIWWDLI